MRGLRKGIRIGKLFEEASQDARENFVAARDLKRDVKIDE